MVRGFLTLTIAFKVKSFQNILQLSILNQKSIVAIGGMDFMVGTLLYIFGNKL